MITLYNTTCIKCQFVLLDHCQYLIATIFKFPTILFINYAFKQHQSQHSYFRTLILVNISQGYEINSYCGYSQFKVHLCIVHYLDMIVMPALYIRTTGN